MMKNLKIKILAVLVVCLSLILPASLQTSQTHADSGVSCGSLPAEVQEASGCTGGNEDRVPGIVVAILYSVIGVAGVVSVVYIVVGGVKYIYSHGNAEMVQEGKRSILYASIGLVITSLAFAIASFSINLINKYKSEGEGGESAETGLITGDTKSFYNLGTTNKAGPGNEVTDLVMINKKSVYVGEKEQLIPHIGPYWLAESEPIAWISDHPEIVSVDKDGNITAKKEGTATITASTKNGKSASTKITVTKQILPETVAIEPGKVKVSSGHKSNLSVTVYPRNAVSKAVKWSSSNKAIATVNGRGQVTGKKPGKANITAKTQNGKSATVEVEVTDDDGEAIKLTSSLLKSLDYYYQTNHNGELSSSCGGSTGSVSCGPAAYMAASSFLAKTHIDFDSFVREACSRGWMGDSGSSLDPISSSGRLAKEYESRFRISLTSIPLSWDSVVKELKKGHPVILLVRKPSDSVIDSQGYALTYHEHFVLALSYRDQGGGQIYIWSPVAETAIPGRNIGNCSEGQCWYDKNAFQRNVNRRAWSVKKVST